MTRWSTIEKRDRMAHVGTAIVGTTSHLATMEVFERTFGRHGVQPEGTCAFVLGETRAGKTTGCDEWMYGLAERLSGTIETETFERSDGSPAAVTSVRIARDDRIERPVIKVLVDAMPTYKGVFSDAVSAILGTSLPKSWDFHRILTTLNRQIAEQKTKLLVFNEVQHISEHRGPDGVYKAADVFKIVMKATRVQIALVGLPHALEIRAANPQLAELTNEVHVIRPFPWDAQEDGELLKFLGAVQHDLPFDRRSDISSTAVARRIHHLTNGYVGRISHLLVGAVEYAVDKKAGSIDRAVLAGYLRDYRSVADAANPFLFDDDELEGFGDRQRKVAAREREAAEKRQTAGARVRNRRRDLGVRGL